MKYLAFISLAMGVSYVILRWVFSRFFEQKTAPMTQKTAYFIVLIIAVSVVANVLSSIVPNEFWGNRLLHAFGGGFTAFLLCFLVVKDAELKLNKFQFLVISILMATALGVANELAEFILQNTTSYIFADSINDTWLDLASNTVGMLIAAAIFTPFVSRK